MELYKKEKNKQIFWEKEFLYFRAENKRKMSDFYDYWDGHLVSINSEDLTDIFSCSSRCLPQLLK